MPVYSMWSKYFVHPNKIPICKQYQYHGYGQNTSKTCMRLCDVFFSVYQLMQRVCVVCMPPLAHHKLHSQPSLLACMDLTAPGSTRQGTSQGGTYRCFRFTKALKAPDGIDPMLLSSRDLQYTTHASSHGYGHPHQPVSAAVSVPHACTLPCSTTP